MTQVARRALITAIVAAPVAGALAAKTAQASSLPRDLRELDCDELLRLGATVPGEARFAALCQLALDARAQEDGAWRLHSDAHDAADAAAPFPTSLLMRMRYRQGDGDIEEWDEQWKPAGDKMGLDLERLAMRRVRENGGDPGDRALISRARADLRADWDAWDAIYTTACRRHLVHELGDAAEAASERSSRAVLMVLAHRTSSREVIRIKLHLRSDDARHPTDLPEWRAVVADLECALI